MKTSAVTFDMQSHNMMIAMIGVEGTGETRSAETGVRLESILQKLAEIFVQYIGSEHFKLFIY